MLQEFSEANANLGERCGKTKITGKQERNLEGNLTFCLFLHTKNLCKFSRDIRYHYLESSDGNVSG